jgi:type IV pilus assembly protein PilQ
MRWRGSRLLNGAVEWIATEMPNLRQRDQVSGRQQLELVGFEDDSGATPSAEAQAGKGPPATVPGFAEAESLGARAAPEDGGPLAPMPGFAEAESGQTELVVKTPPGEPAAAAREPDLLAGGWGPGTRDSLGRTSSPEPPAPSAAGMPPVTLHLDDVDVRKALEMLSREGSVNILVSPGVTGRVTADLRNLSFDQALDALLKLCNLVGRWDNGILFVYSPEQAPQRERQVRTFPLDFTSAADALPAVQVLLSPVGQAFVTETVPTDNRKTVELIVVEDLPEYLERIEQYIRQIDRPPRQVMIEVHVLQVDLDDETRHGVNFEQAISWLGNTTKLRLQGLANPLSQGFFVDVDGASLDALVEFLKTTTDAKTLASPRVLVVNGQEARIQIGERFGYRVTRVTETAAIEDVEFLELGVVLSVTPRISRDNRVVMRVKPEVSSGQINADTELPEEETTEVATDVLLASGRGIVIGGLIQEKDSNVQSKIPWLGDLRLAGLLFGRREIEKTRSEIIITLMPRVLPYDGEYEVRDQIETSRAATPLFYGPLCRSPRPWEPGLPDAVYRPRLIRIPAARRAPCPLQRGSLDSMPRESLPAPPPEASPPGAGATR